MAKAKSEYTSPYAVGKRPTVYIDAQDPRVRGFKAGITAARLGAELEIINDPTTSFAGGFSSLKFSGAPSNLRIPEYFDPNSESFVKPTTISNLSASWTGTTLVITFNFDFTDDSNKYVDKFEYRLTSSGSSSLVLQETNINKAGLLQTINFTKEKNIEAFNLFKQSFSLLEVRSKDSFGNVSSFITLSVIPSYSNNLPAPVTTVTAISQGYSVDWDPIVQDYQYISVEEIVSNASTAPTSGYQEVYLSKIKPATIITPTTEARWVRARFTDGAGTYSNSYSVAAKVTPISPVTADTTGPNNVASATTTSGIDTSGYLGFNAYADISWPAVTGGGIRGYRIRFTNDNGTTYSYVDSPGTGTTYRLGGLAIGATYKIAVATYDEYNNLSSEYVAATPDVTVTGTPSVSNYITGGPFQFGVGVGGVSTNKGLYFDASNYWYVNATNSARLKVGGSTSNYLEWNGSTFAVDGNITARQGSFTGNVSIVTGGSLIAGTVGSSSVIVNSSGLSANNSVGAALTEILTTPLGNGAITPGSNSLGAWTTGELINFFTKSAMIGGWIVTDSLIKDRSNQFQLDSTNKRIFISGVTGESTNFQVRFGTALTGSGSGTTNIFEAGIAGQKPKFYITQTGDLTATNASLTGALASGVEGPGQSVMKFGQGVGGQGQDGIFLNGTNYWYVDDDSTNPGIPGRFSLGGGVLSGSDTTVDLNLTGNNNLRFLNMPFSDDDGWAGDPTISVRYGLQGNNPNTGQPYADYKIVQGRRFIYSSSAPASNVVLTNKVGNFTVGDKTTQVKVGDILMVS